MKKATIKPVQLPFRRQLRLELRALRIRRRKAASVTFTTRERWEMVILLLLGLLAMAAGAYLFSHFNGEIWEV